MVLTVLTNFLKRTHAYLILISQRPVERHNDVERFSELHEMKYMIKVSFNCVRFDLIKIISAGVVVDRLIALGRPVTEADKTCVMMAGLCHDLGQ